MYTTWLIFQKHAELGSSVQKNVKCTSPMYAACLEIHFHRSSKCTTEAIGLEKLFHTHRNSCIQNAELNSVQNGTYAGSSKGCTLESFKVQC